MIVHTLFVLLFLLYYFYFYFLLWKTWPEVLLRNIDGFIKVQTAPIKRILDDKSTNRRLPCLGCRVISPCVRVAARVTAARRSMHFAEVIVR